MTLVRLAGPFDDTGGPAAAPPTPTCCCCCCCLVTTLTASTVAGVTVHRESEISGQDRSRRSMLTLAAGLTVLLGWVPFSLAIWLGAGLVEDAPDWLLIVLWVTSVLGVWLLWMRLVLGWAGSPAFPAWWWSAKFTAATAVAFVAELVTLGFAIYGQLAAVPVAVAVGIVMRRRFKAAR